MIFSNSLLIHDENTKEICKGIFIEMEGNFMRKITSVSCLDTMVKNVHKLNQLLPQPELQMQSGAELFKGRLALILG